MADDFVILHGWGNRRPVGHWQRWLADELTARGHTVRYPALPDPDEPSLGAWLDVLAGCFDGLDAEKTTVVAHSLGVALWLRAAQRQLLPTVARALLVSPPSPEVLADTVVSEFVPHTPSALGAREGLIIAGTGDPFAPEGPRPNYAAPLGLPVLTIPGGGHLTPEDGYGPFPQVLEWVAP